MNTIHWLQESNAMQNPTIEYYVWWDTPIIFNDILQTAYHYIDGKWLEMSKHDFIDYAEKTVDNDEIEKIFSDSILEEYQNYVNIIHEKITATLYTDIEKNQLEVTRLKKSL